MNIIQVGSSSLYNIGSGYTIKLNEKEMLVVEEDPVSRSQFKSRKEAHKKEQEEKKAEEAKKSSDGKMYAIGGEVSISSPTGSTPQETIKNARQIIAAAMAASDPSSQDFTVAASARMMEMQARQQKTKELQTESDEAQGKVTYANEASSLNATSKDEDFLGLDISA